VVVLVADLVSHLIEEKGSLGLGDCLREGVGLQEPDLGKTNHRVIRSYSLVICFRPLFRTRLYF
jgi:hypothetical protein